MSYITYQDLTVQNGTTDQFFIYDSATNITINNVTISGGATGINIITGTFADISITSTEISNYTGTGIALYSVTGGGTNITIDGVTENSGTGTRGIYISAGTWNGIDILNSVFSNHSAQGIQTASSVVNDLTITDVTASSNNGYGVYLGGSGSNYDIHGLTANSNGSTADYDGLYLNTSSSSLSNITIEESEFNSNDGNGLAFASTGSTSSVLSTNASSNDGDGFNIHNAWTDLTFNNCIANSNGLVGQSGAGDGFSFHETSTGTIRNSIAQDNMKSSVANVGSAQVVMYNNLFSHTTNGTLALVYLSETGTYSLYNNTIYSAGHIGSGLNVVGPTLDVKNNIIYGFDIGFQKTSGTITEDYNDVYGATTANFSGLTPGTHSLQLDPKLNNPPTDFSLQSDSPAIDSAYDTSITTDYAGKQRYDDPDVANTGAGAVPYYDMGAYEYVLPPDPIFTSSSHPSQSSWYSNTTVNMSLSSNGSSTTNYYYLVNQNATPTKAEVLAGTFDADGIFTVTISSDGQWYIHTIAVNLDNDPSTNYSSYLVQIDTVPPSIPGTPSTSSLTNNNKPEWTWTASTDATSGLGDPAYNVQWCDNSSFIGCDLNISTSTTNSFTHSIALADGTWYFRVQAIDKAGNTSDWSASGTDTILTVIPFNEKINLKDAVLNQTYQSQQNNVDLLFYLLPKQKTIKDLYIKLIRNKKKHLNGFTKKNSYPGYLKLLSNIGTVKKAYQKNVNKHINFRVSVRYSKTKLNKTNIKEKNLRLFIKDRDGIWRGPYRIYQNKTTHTLKFKIRNYLVRQPKNPIPNPLDVKTKNRPFAPTFYFRTLKKIKFVIAEKNALSNLTNLETSDSQDFFFE